MSDEDSTRAARAAYMKAYREMSAANARARARRQMAMPPWLDCSAVQAIYKQAVKVSEQTGVKHHVDHVIPLKHRLVCGLHVPWNLRVITQSENCAKRNRFDPFLEISNAS